jgi:hypothetical protein
MYFIFLCILLLLLCSTKESFVIHMDTKDASLYDYVVLPVYQKMSSFIPFKNHYRKVRRYLK